MRVFLVDDEELALEVLERILGQIENVQVIGKYTEPQEAFDKLMTEKVDVVFLDLEMGGLSGLEFARRLLHKEEAPEVVFVTAYAQYAVEAFEVDAMDYLLKPITKSRLEKSIQKVEDKLKIKSIARAQLAEGKKNVYIHALKEFQVFNGEKESTAPMRWRTKKVKEMFCYLWLNNEKPVNKYRILEELWADTPLDKSTVLLHTTVYQLRKAIKELGYDEGLQYMNDQYILTLPMKSDLEELKTQLRESEPTAEQMRRLLTIYEGDLLEQNEYDWCIYERQNLRNAYLSYLEKYIDKNLVILNNDILENCLQKLLRLDVYNEKYVFLLMKYYADNGNGKGVIKAYEYYSKVIREELGLIPSKKIIELYHRFIKRG